jgi:hypothetical protein
VSAWFLAASPTRTLSSSEKATQDGMWTRNMVSVSPGPPRVYRQRKSWCCPGRWRSPLQARTYTTSWFCAYSCGDHGKHLALTLPETESSPSVRMFAECILSGTWQRDSLPGVPKKTLGKTPILSKQMVCRVSNEDTPQTAVAANGSQPALTVCRVPPYDTRQILSLPSVFFGHSVKS